MLTRTTIFRTLSIGLSAVLFCFVLAPRAYASQWNEMTWVTFTAPVEVPGHALPAGTYDFQLMNLPSDRDVVEIFNKYRTKLYAIVMGEPTYRMQPTSKTVFTFKERPVDTPEAIHKWFYPGHLYGLEFFYSHPKQVEVAEASVPKTLTAIG
jgi:hypothetical protein